MGVARIRQKLGMGTPILGAPVLAFWGVSERRLTGRAGKSVGLWPMSHGMLDHVQDGELSQQTDHLPPISMKPLSHL